MPEQKLKVKIAVNHDMDNVELTLRQGESPGSQTQLYKLTTNQALSLAETIKRACDPIAHVEKEI